MTVLTVVFALLCALSNAAATVYQRRAVAERPAVDGSGVKAAVTRLLRPLRRPMWWGGAAAMLSATVFQVLALATGRLVVVQPLLASELLFTLLLISAVFHHRPNGVTWCAFVMLAAGLALFLLAASPSGGSSHAAWWRWLAAGSGALFFTGCLLVVARHVAGAARAAVLGGATAVGFSFTAALTKETTELFPGGVSAVFTSWPLYATAAVGAFSMLLLQVTLRAGSIIASQPAMTLGDALISVMLGMALFGERIALGWLVLPELVAAGLIAAGVIIITRTPIMTYQPSQDLVEG